VEPWNATRQRRRRWWRGIRRWRVWTIALHVWDGGESLCQLLRRRSRSLGRFWRRRFRQRRRRISCDARWRRPGPGDDHGAISVRGGAPEYHRVHQRRGLSRASAEWWEHGHGWPRRRRRTRRRRRNGVVSPVVVQRAGGGGGGGMGAVRRSAGSRRRRKEEGRRRGLW